MVNATSHILVLPQLFCHEDCCRHKLVPQDTLAISHLKDDTNWWSCTFVGAFASLIAHCCEQPHKPNIKVIFRFSQNAVWDPIQVEPDVEKIIVLELTDQHYTLSVFRLQQRTVTCYNGFTQLESHRSFSVRTGYEDRVNARDATIANLLQAADLGAPAEWIHIEIPSW